MISIAGGTLLLPGAVALSLCICAPQRADSVASINLTGMASAIVSISAGSANGSGQFATALESAGTGAAVQSSSADAPDPTASINLGDISQGDGSPITAMVSLRVRSNVHFKITMAKTAFSAVNLHYQGRDISGTGDGGSFLEVTAGPTIQAMGPDANPSACSISSALRQGISLAQVASGNTGNSALVVASGDRVSLKGGARGNNGVDIPVRFQCPTGTVFGPVRGGQGSFSATVQFEAFPGS